MPEVREKLGLCYEELAEVNPRLIYGSMSAYGETGPEAGQTGFDTTAYWARSGLMDLVRPDPDGDPARSMPGQGDHPTGLALFSAILLALIGGNAPVRAVGFIRLFWPTAIGQTLIWRRLHCAALRCLCALVGNWLLTLCQTTTKVKTGVG